MTALEIFKTILKWLQIMAVSYAKENVGISGLIVNAEESNESDS